MLANAKQVREALKKFDDYKQLTGANQVDVRLLRDNVESEIFRLEELREADWNPLVYNQSLANSLYLLVARNFDSAQKRIPNLRQRMDDIPNVIKQAEARTPSLSRPRPPSTRHSCSFTKNIFRRPTRKL